MFRRQILEKETFNRLQWLLNSLSLVSVLLFGACWSRQAADGESAWRQKQTVVLCGRTPA